MANLTKGNFSINLGIVTIGGELSDDDRQCAWELYTELSTRVAVIGKEGALENKEFDGEVYSESLDSLYRFFQESRLIMRKFPVGKLDSKTKDHLGILINRVISDVLRPFLEKWQSRYRHWWEFESDKELTPCERQFKFPDLEEFLEDWKNVRYLMRELQSVLVESYELVEV